MKNNKKHGLLENATRKRHYISPSSSSLSPTCLQLETLSEFDSTRETSLSPTGSVLPWPMTRNRRRLTPAAHDCKLCLEATSPSPAAPISPSHPRFPLNKRSSISLAAQSTACESITANSGVSKVISKNVPLLSATPNAEWNSSGMA